MASKHPPRATSLAYDALLALAVAAGEHVDAFVVVGGLAPPTLASTAAVPHHGTTDLDLLVEVGLVYDDDVDLGWLELALDEARFRPTSGWRWEWSDAPVRVDLVCDRAGSSPGEVPLPGCREASAMNLPGPRAVWCDAVRRTLPVPPGLGGGAVTVRFAGLGGYLLAKASAARVRELDRDFYDFYFVALHNDAGGPAAAGNAMRHGTCAHALAELGDALRFTLRRAVAGDRPGAVAYAREMRATGDDTPYDVLVEDAATAAFGIARAVGIDLG